MPATLDDLAKPAYKGLLVVENPATSSPGLAFLLATIARVRRRRLARLLGEAARQRREGRRRLGEAYNGEFTAGRQQGDLPARGVVRVEPAGRGVLLEAAAEDVADRHHARHVLPPGRVRRRARGHRAPRRRTQARRLHAVERVPGRHAAADVRVPRARRHAAARRCSASSPRSPPSPLTLPPAEIGAQPRRVDRAVDRHRAAVIPSHGRRAASVARVSVPLAFLAVFFVYPVASIVGRGLAPDGDARPRPARATCRDRRVAAPRRCGSRSGRPPLSTVLTLAGRAAGRVRARPLRVPRAARGARAGDRAVRAADGRRRLGVPSAARPGRPARRPRTRPDGRGRSCSPTCSSTTRSWCAPSAASGRTSTPRRRTRRGCSARSRWRAFREVTLPALRPAIAAAAAIVFLFTLHVVRRDPRSSAARATRRSRPRSTARPRSCSTCRSRPRSRSCSSSPSSRCSS